MKQLLWSGSDRPQLPAGIWWGSGTQVGDASGGQLRIRFEFSAEGDPASGDIYSLEQMSGFISIITQTKGWMSTIGMAPQAGSSLFDRLWAILYDSTAPTLAQASMSDDTPLLPILIGTLRGGVDDIGALEFGVDNPTATDSLSVTAMGYRWTSRSVLAEGGPQRPSNSIFGKS